MTMTTCELQWLKGVLASLGVIHPTPMSLHCEFVIVKLFCTYLKIWFFMNALSTSKSIVTLFAMQLLKGIFAIVLSRLLSNWPIFLPKLCDDNSIHSYFVSWTFVICILQLKEGYCDIIVYLYFCVNNILGDMGCCIRIVCYSFHPIFRSNLCVYITASNGMKDSEFLSQFT